MRIVSGTERYAHAIHVRRGKAVLTVDNLLAAAVFALIVAMAGWAFVESEAPAPSQLEVEAVAQHAAASNPK